MLKQSSMHDDHYEFTTVPGPPVTRRCWIETQLNDLTIRVAEGLIRDSMLAPISGVAWLSNRRALCSDACDIGRVVDEGLQLWEEEMIRDHSPRAFYDTGATSSHPSEKGCDACRVHDTAFSVKEVPLTHPDSELGKRVVIFARIALCLRLVARRLPELNPSGEDNDYQHHRCWWQSNGFNQLNDLRSLSILEHAETLVGEKINIEEGELDSLLGSFMKNLSALGEHVCRKRFGNPTTLTVNHISGPAYVVFVPLLEALDIDNRGCHALAASGPEHREQYITIPFSVPHYILGAFEPGNPGWPTRPGLVQGRSGSSESPISAYNARPWSNNAADANRRATSTGVGLPFTQLPSDGFGFRPIDVMPCSSRQGSLFAFGSVSSTQADKRMKMPYRPKMGQILPNNSVSQHLLLRSSLLPAPKPTRPTKAFGAPEGSTRSYAPPGLLGRPYPSPGTRRGSQGTPRDLFTLPLPPSHALGLNRSEQEPDHPVVRKIVS